MVGFAEKSAELKNLGTSVVAASVDPLDKAKEVADEVNFPIGHGVTRDIANTLGSWWEDRRQIIQPSQFVVGPENKVMASCYSDGPIGRFIADDVVKFVTFAQSQRK